MDSEQRRLREALREAMDAVADPSAFHAQGTDHTVEAFARWNAALATPDAAPLSGAPASSALGHDDTGSGAATPTHPVDAMKAVIGRESKPDDANEAAAREFCDEPMPECGTCGGSGEVYDKDDWCVPCKDCQGGE